MHIEGFALRVREVYGRRKVDAVMLVDGTWRLISTVEPESCTTFTGFVSQRAIALSPVDPHGANENEGLRTLVRDQAPVSELVDA